MEVEVKLRLPDAASHQKLSDLLAPFHVKTLIQENIFFDGAAAELSSKFAVLRLRFYDLDSRCVLSLKSQPQISNGISRAKEVEEEIEPLIGRACVAEPWRFKSMSSRIIKRLRDEFEVGDEGLVCLGGFRNVRAVYAWNGLNLELDETLFDFGTNYEIECESSEPERAKKLLEGFLEENGISFSNAEASKFAVFRSGKLHYKLQDALRAQKLELKPERQSETLIQEQVLSHVLQEAGYTRESSFLLEDFIKVLGSSSIKMDVEIPVD